MIKLLEKYKLQYNNVVEFNRLFGFEKDSSVSSIALREALYQEEKNELFTALKNNDVVELADGVADCMYIILGSMDILSENEKAYKLYLEKLVSMNGLIAEYFTDRQFFEVFEVVHKSNMSKACDSLDTAFKTMATDKYKNLSAFAVRKDNCKYALYCNANYPDLGLAKGKLLKSIDYTPADLNFVKKWNIQIL
jgi:predicted HAD superfamily Cof-like phosphohydrolase